MIKIKYTNDTEFPGAFTMCKEELTDEVDCTNAMSAFVRVLQFAGYQNESIRSAAEAVEYDMSETIAASADTMASRK